VRVVVTWWKKVDASVGRAAASDGVASTTMLGLTPPSSLVHTPVRVWQFTNSVRNMTNMTRLLSATVPSWCLSLWKHAGEWRLTHWHSSGH
jgi:hypothetical protein